MSEQKRVVVVGGGISGLASAWYLRERSGGACEVVVCERDATLGGTAKTERHGGYTVDLGLNGFLTNVPYTVELAEALGLGDALEEASPLAKRRFLFFKEGLRPLPMSPPAFVQTPLLSWRGKLRLFGEPWAGASADPARESVHGFAARRLGVEAADVFMQSLVLGITAGDARETSLEALFPKMRAMEQAHGSLFKAMLATRRASAGAAELEGASRVGGKLTSFGRDGIARIIGALRDALGESVRVGAEAVETAYRPERAGRRWEVVLRGGERLEADAVVVATPSYAAAEVLKRGAPEVSEVLARIGYGSVRVVALGYAREDVPHAMDGLGFLVPRGQGVRVLGCQWTSSLFPSQAPARKASLRVIVGGAFDPEIVEMSDDEVLWEVRRDLSRTMGIVARPELVRHAVWRRAIPHYALDHGEKVASIRERVARRPGLHMAGNAYEGIGFNDCVLTSRRVAQAVWDELADVGG